MGPLAIKLGLGAIARPREPTRGLQASGEHREDEGHGGSSIVAMAPSLSLPHIRPGPLATVCRLAARIEARYYGAQADQLSRFVNELVALKCDVILAAAPHAIRAVPRPRRE